MTFKTTQKVIKIGTSAGVTLPAKDLKKLNLKAGDEVELVVRKPQEETKDSEIIKAAEDILARYKQDFENLAKR